MTVSTHRLVQIAAYGGLIVSATGFYLQMKLIDKVRSYDYYKEAMKSLRRHAGAVHYLGEPIKDKRFRMTDTENNYSDANSARFGVPVVGTKDRGTYYFWAENNEEHKWKVVKAELELKSKPDVRLTIVKADNSQNKQ